MSFTQKQLDAVESAIARCEKTVLYADRTVAELLTYNQATRAASQIEERMGTLEEQAGKAAAAINKIAGNANPALANIIPTGAFGKDLTPAVEAVKPFPHLLIIQPLKPQSQPYYFNRDTAAFEELSRTTDFRWASQERLTRRPAQQASGKGEERIKLKGSIYPGFKGGLEPLDTLHNIGAQLQPLGLSTGYGHLNGTVEAMLDANQGLADEVQPFRAGVMIVLSDLVVPSEERGDVVGVVGASVSWSRQFAL